MTDLANHIQATALIDTHEHMNKETAFVNEGPDILQSVFDHYTANDLVAAGASADAIKSLYDRSNPDIRARFEGVRAAWERSQFTGYGEGARWVAKHLFGIDEIGGAALEAAAPKANALHKPGERLRLLRDLAKLDHVQVDDFQFTTLPDPSGPDFFLYDLSWWGWACGNVNPEAIKTETGIEVTDLATLRRSFEASFARYAPVAIALKTQHAYQRTLLWRKRDDTDAERVLLRLLRKETISDDERLCFGDWCMARGVELATQHNLPVKIHTGYYAGNNHMRMDRIDAGQLCDLLLEYPQAKFVLMHTAYPYGDEIVALAKHFPNVYADMCWTWSIDPFSSATFLRQMIHAAPSHKLLVFGGDSFWPHAAVAYAWQARRGLTRALQAEIDAGDLSKAQAMRLATQFMNGNQRDCFDIDGTRAAIKDAP